MLCVLGWLDAGRLDYTFLDETAYGDPFIYVLQALVAHEKAKGKDKVSH
jgi:hypothetical protein